MPLCPQALDIDATRKTRLRNKSMLAALLWFMNIGTAHADKNMPIVLELFTSQGCSSCGR
jgi:hypothetical protein